MLIFLFSFFMYMWIVLQQNWVICTISKGARNILVSMDDFINHYIYLWLRYNSS
jgi:hypothetical protein